MAQVETVPAKKLHKLNPKRRNRLQQQAQERSSIGVSEEELARRRKQAQLRELALKLRSEGRSYKGPWQLGKRRPADGSEPPAKRPKQPKGEVPQVIVVPIFWRSRVDETSKVMEASRQAVALLTEAGVGAVLDTDDSHTPGQRMKFWEARGVKVRLEVGPKEALSGGVILARAKAPGEVADRSSVHNIAKKLVGAVTAALNEAGVEIKPLSAPSPAADAEAQADAAAGSSADAAAKGQQQQAPDTQEPPPKQRAKKAAKRAQPADDATGAVDAEEAATVSVAVAAAQAAEAAMAGGAKQAKKRKKQQQPPAEPADDGAGSGAAASGLQTPAAAAPVAVEPAAAQLASADALDDGFDVEVDAEEDRHGGAKKQGKWAKLKAKKRANKAGSGGADGAGGAAAVGAMAGGTGSGGQTAKKKKVKVVKF